MLLWRHFQKKKTASFWDCYSFHIGGSWNHSLCSPGTVLVQNSKHFWFAPQRGSDCTDVCISPCWLHIYCSLHPLHETLSSRVHEWTLHWRGAEWCVAECCCPHTRFCQQQYWLHKELHRLRGSWNSFQPKCLLCVSCNHVASVWAGLSGHQRSSHGAQTHDNPGTSYGIGYQFSGTAASRTHYGGQRE